MSYLRRTSKSIGTPPQSMPLDSTQVPNSAGGYSYQVDKWKQLERFLILGSEGGSYYASEKKLTFENVASLEACLKEDGDRTVRIIREISDAGRAPKNDPALFALAYCISNGDQHTRQYAADTLGAVARIGTHLFHFAEFAQNMRGWGRVLKGAVGNWYKNMPADRMVEQLIKYRQRDGWTHGELLRLSHPHLDAEKEQLARWVLKSEGYQKWAETELTLPPRLRAHIQLQELGPDGADKVAGTFNNASNTAAKLIRDYRLTWESVPTPLLNAPVVWEALLEHMPITALIRNLGKMTSIGLLKPFADGVKLVTAVLANEALLKKRRVHPIAILNALRTYQQGHGEKGSLTWTPVTQIITALDEAFYLAFRAIEPTHKNFYFGLDVSGSMSSPCSGMPSLACREGTAVMTMVSVRKEPNTYIRGFCDKFVDLPLTPRTSLTEAVAIVHRSDFGGTDCALPMLDALERRLEVDEFVVMTDSETWAGRVHPKQALDMYRQKMGRAAKLVVVGMVANPFTIADPKDAGMLDLIGFDTVCPQLISQFAL